jgi:glycogen debranching enzyme
MIPQDSAPPADTTLAPAAPATKDLPVSRIRFAPHEYRDLSESEQTLLGAAYDHAISTIRRNITPMGFSACSLNDNESIGTDDNYRSVWARDGALTVIWTLDLDDEAIRACQRQTLLTLLSHQTANGQIPANVRIDSGKPDYSGVGGIAAIDSVLWAVIACCRFAEYTQDWDFIRAHEAQLQKAVDWLSAHDSNQCGLIEVPEASDWADLFGFSYHVLYDEVLWYHALRRWSFAQGKLGNVDRAQSYYHASQITRQRLVSSFWPTTAIGATEGGVPRSFTDAQFSLGDARYLIAQVSPFSFSWRCDVYGNMLAFLVDVTDARRAMMTFRFLWGVGANEPWPAKNLYPPVQAGDPEWRDYYAVNLLNLPNHYHNGGIWPFIGGMWVRFIHKLGLKELARRELVKVARLCQMGVTSDWEFNEWHHATTGRPMGKRYQAWSAASFINACHQIGLSEFKGDA